MNCDAFKLSPTDGRRMNGIKRMISTTSRPSPPFHGGEGEEVAVVVNLDLVVPIIWWLDWSAEFVPRFSRRLPSRGMNSALQTNARP
jgi:hypothetical protein